MSKSLESWHFYSFVVKLTDKIFKNLNKFKHRHQTQKMEKATKNINTKQRQFEIMLNFMTEHPQLAKGYIKAPDAKQATNDLWTRLAEHLNTAGPPMRDVVGWKKVWADHKTHLKAKLRKNRISFSGTGGGPAKMYSFTALEEGVIDLLQLKEAVDGMSGVRKFGVNSTHKTGDDTGTATSSNDIEQDVAHMLNCITNDLRETEELVSAPSPPRCSSAARTLITRRSPFNRAVPKKQTLLEKQVDGQMDYQKRSISLLEEVNTNLKSLVRYKRRQIDIEEKNYKLAKRKFEHEMKLSVENQKLKLAKLDIKREMVEIERSRNL